MDILAQIFLIVSGASLAVAAMLAIFSHHRDLVILFTWLGVISLVTSGFAWFQDREWKRDQPLTDERAPVVIMGDTKLILPTKAGDPVIIDFVLVNNGNAGAKGYIKDATYCFSTDPSQKTFKYLPSTTAINLIFRRWQTPNGAVKCDSQILNGLQNWKRC